MHNGWSRNEFESGKRIRRDYRKRGKKKSAKRELENARKKESNLLKKTGSKDSM